MVRGPLPERSRAITGRVSLFIFFIIRIETTVAQMGQCLWRSLGAASRPRPLMEFVHAPYYALSLRSGANQIVEGGGIGRYRACPGLGAPRLAPVNSCSGDVRTVLTPILTSSLSPAPGQHRPDFRTSR